MAIAPGYWYRLPRRIWALLWHFSFSGLIVIGMIFIMGIIIILRALTRQGIQELFPQTRAIR